jgi:hypothetical protein
MTRVRECSCGHKKQDHKFRRHRGEKSGYMGCVRCPGYLPYWGFRTSSQHCYHPLNNLAYLEYLSVKNNP